MTTALRRLMTEHRELTISSPHGIQAGPASEDNYFVWDAVVIGPEDTPYEHGVFMATLAFPPDYPLAPPVMKFTTHIYHPNVYPDGTVCISILHAPGIPLPLPITPCALPTTNQHQAMIQRALRWRRSGGPPSRVSKKSSSPSCPCWPSRMQTRPPTSMLLRCGDLTGRPLIAL
jgi:ubiquitin-protein ligase